MKIILASILSLLASSVGATSVKTTKRALQVGDDRYHVLRPTVGLSTDGTEFLLNVPHQEGDGGGAGEKYAYIFKECPHGEAQAQVAEPNDNYLGTLGGGASDPAWISVSSGWAMTGSGPYDEDITFSFLPTAADEDDIWTLSPSNPPPFGSTSVAHGTAKVCVWYGFGPDGGEDAYGFREIVLKAKFDFNGEFVCTSFETQAYNPVTGQEETQKEYTTEAEMCSSDPARPGLPICMEICPDENDGLVFIQAVNYVHQCEVTNAEVDPETSLTSSPDEWEIVGLDIDGLEANIVCSGDADAGDFTTPPITPTCCQVWYVLPSKFFPTWNTQLDPVDEPAEIIKNPTDPSRAYFQVCGEVDLRPMPLNEDGSVADVPPSGTHGLGVRTNVEGQFDCPDGEEEQEGGGCGPVRRMLQESTTIVNEKAPIRGSLTYEIASPEESSSMALGASAAVAAAGALGAALLL